MRTLFDISTKRAPPWGRRSSPPLAVAGTVPAVITPTRGGAPIRVRPCVARWLSAGRPELPARRRCPLCRSTASSGPRRDGRQHRLRRVAGFTTRGAQGPGRRVGTKTPSKPQQPARAFRHHPTAIWFTSFRAVAERAGSKGRSPRPRTASAGILRRPGSFTPGQTGRTVLPHSPHTATYPRAALLSFRSPPALDALSTRFTATNSTVYVRRRVRNCERLEPVTPAWPHSNAIHRARARLGRQTADSTVNAVQLTPDGFAGVDSSVAPSRTSTVSPSMASAGVDCQHGACCIRGGPNQVVKGYGANAPILSLSTDGTYIYSNRLYVIRRVGGQFF